MKKLLSGLRDIQSQLDELNLETLSHVEQTELLSTLGDLRHSLEDAGITNGSDPFFSLVEQSPDLILRLDKDLLITYANQTLQGYYGVSIEDLRGRTVDDLYLSEPLNDLVELALTIPPGAEQSQHVEYMQDISGKLRVFDAVVLPEHDAHGKASGIIIVIHDITARKQIESRLSSSEKRYRLLFERNLSPVFRSALDGQILDCNEAFAKVLGFESVAELLATPTQSMYFDPSHRKAFTELLRLKGSLSNLEFMLRRKDGSPLWVIGEAVLVDDDDEEGPFIQATMIDITSRKQAEHDLQVTNRLLDGLTQAQSAYISGQSIQDILKTLLDNLIEATESEYGFISEVVTQADGSPALQTWTVSDMVWSEELQNFYDQYIAEGVSFANLNNLFGTVITTRDAVIANEIVEHPEAQGTPEGHPPLRAFLGIPLMAGDRIVAMVGLANRIDHYTEDLLRYLEPLLLTGARIIDAYRNDEQRELAEKALHESEARFRALVDSMDDLIAIIDRAGKLTNVYGRWIEQGETPISDYIGKTIEQIFEGEAEAHLAAHQKALSGESSAYEWALVNPYLTIQMVITPLRDESGEIVGTVAVGRDITLLKETSNLLEQYTQRLQNLREIDQAILEAQSPRDTAQAVLEHISQLLPAERATIVLFSEINGTGTGRILALKGGEETQLNIGYEFPIEDFGAGLPALNRGEIVSVEDIIEMNNAPALLRALAEEGMRSCLIVPLIADGDLISALYLSAASANAFSDDHIDVAREIADVLAISIHHAGLYEQVQNNAAELAQKVAESTQELEAAHYQVQVLTRIKEEFVSSISHELRTPIASLKLYHHLLRSRPEKSDQYLQTLVKETNRLERLVEDLLTVTELDQNIIHPSPQAVDLNELVNDCVTTRQQQAIAREIKLDLKSQSMPTISADPILLRQAILGMLSNALNYTPEGGRVRVTTGAKQQGDTQWLTITITDTGPGIPEHERDRIFERFYRGKVGRDSGVPGAGLGLAMAKQIVEQSNGQIILNNTRKGASFTIMLPHHVEI